MCKSTNYSTKKYHLKFYLDQMPFKERAALIKKLPGELGIGPSKFRNLIYAEIGSPHSLSAENCLQLANFFKIEPHDLVNEDFTTVQSTSNDLGLTS